MAKTMKVISVFILAVALLFPAISMGAAQAASFSDDGLTFDLSKQQVNNGIVDIVDNQQIIQENLIKDLKIPTKPISSCSVIVSEGQVTEKVGPISELKNLPVQEVRTGIVDIVDNQQIIQENQIKDLKIPTKPISSCSVIVSEGQVTEKVGPISELKNLPVQEVRTGIVDIVDNQQIIQENQIKDLKIPTKPISSGSVIVSEEQAAEKAGQISVRSTYPLNGSLAPNKYRAWTFWRNVGQTSNFSCSWSPAVTIGAGLLDGNGNWIFFNYFTGSCNLNASFAQSGNYSWALCNTSSSTITYNGSFTY